MTEAEALELYAMYISNAMTAFTIYISFTFAYLVTAFYVGFKLTSFQVIVAGGIYVISAGSITMSLIGNLQASESILNATTTVIDELALHRNGLWVSTMSLILTLGIIVSLYFMWSVRNPKPD